MIGQTVYKQTEKKRLLFYISRYIIYYRVSLKHFSFFCIFKRLYKHNKHNKKFTMFQLRQETKLVKN